MCKSVWRSFRRISKQQNRRISRYIKGVRRIFCRCQNKIYEELESAGVPGRQNEDSIDNLEESSNLNIGTMM